MASGLIGEAILIIASVIVAGTIAGVVLSQVGVFESTITTTTDAQQDKLLTDVDIIFASNSSDTIANVWVKNTGNNPLADNTKVDVYFGPIGAVQRYAFSTSGGDNSWEFHPSTPSVWQQKDTIQLNITDNDLAKGVTYEVIVTTPNGISDEFIFSIPS